MQSLAGAFFIFLIAITGVTETSFAQLNNGDEKSIATWEFGRLTNLDNHIDPIITGNTVSVESMDEWLARKKRFLDCGLCGEVQAFPEE